jgi:hypothetical protein
MHPTTMPIQKQWSVPRTVRIPIAERTGKDRDDRLMNRSNLSDLEVVRRDQGSDEQNAENTETPSVERLQKLGEVERYPMLRGKGTYDA